jgi:electron-transferring-flavoprotein dehydrogenase
MQYDVVIVGGGIAGIATAIKLKQESAATGTNLSVVVFEKGSFVGANVISGCVVDPVGLNELIPNWHELNLIETTPVRNDTLYYLTPKGKLRLPHVKEWSNAGNYIISLSQLCVKLAQYAEELGIEFYAGFPVVDVVINNGKVVGVKTAAFGLDKNSQPKANYEPGMTVFAKQVVIAEGCRGSLAKKLIKQFSLDHNSSPQTFGLGIKEIWQVNSRQYQPGTVEHFIGYPLNNNAYGGGFIYHMNKNRIAIGLVTALDYTNPYLSPFDEFQKFKLHAAIKPLLDGAKRLEYGARAVVEGGLQALPELVFPGGVLVGDCAGFINVPKIKGVHNAIKSGILAAYAVIEAIKHNHDAASSYQSSFKHSTIYQELYKVRNIRPAFKMGLIAGILYTAIDHYIFKGKAPWTFHWRRADNERLKYASKVTPLNYAKPDNKITFDKASSVYLANINHDDSQPSHLKLKNAAIPIKINLELFASPETRYCPAGVYEIRLNHNNNTPQLHINAQNCVHCKACDIKDPIQNITWVPPESGSGPQYTEM